MRQKSDRFVFGAHALERAQERMLGKMEPYTQDDYDNIKKLILLNMNWNEFSCNWELRDYGLEFIIKNDKVVTIAPLTDKNKDVTKIQPITQFYKDNIKKIMKLGRSHGSYKRNT